MLNELKDVSGYGKKLTDKGAVAYCTTYSKTLDFFGSISELRYANDDDIIDKFMDAFNEDPKTAVKMLFWVRDVRGGAGERKAFRVISKHLMKNSPEVLVQNLHLIPFYGRWDDLVELQDFVEAYNIIRNQISLDMTSDNPSLLGKWLPSITTSSYKTVGNAISLSKKLGYTLKQYRKMTTSLRDKIKIVERALSEKDYASIDYSKLPSKASAKYRAAFYRNDEERYSEFLESLANGKSKVNSSTLYPHEIVDMVLKGDTKMFPLYQGMWDNLPDYTNGKSDNSLCVVDTSGSMTGIPIKVAVALGMYFSERNKGIFKDTIITFSNNPELVTLTKKTLHERIDEVFDTDWGGTTNLAATFDLILSAATKHNLPKEEMIEKLYIFSDMQFDSIGGRNVNQNTILQQTKEKWALAGYDLPKIVFWNLEEAESSFPFNTTEENVQLVSGFSPSIFKHLMNDQFLSPIDFMKSVVWSERYDPVIV